MSQTTEQLQKSDIKDILENSLNGKRPGPDDCMRLLESDDVHLMGLVSGHLTRKQFGKKASFVNNIILNYTNVCITDCKFCAFYRSPGADDAYTLTLEQIESRVKTAWDMFKIRQVLIQGGHNPNLKIEYYEDAFRMIREKFPKVGVHGLSTSEIDMIARVEKSSTKKFCHDSKMQVYNQCLVLEGEILTDSVKEIISPRKSLVMLGLESWMAHSLGIPSSATMMYGHVENKNDIVEHFFKLVKLQEKTKGFMAFIPWNFEPNNTLMHEEGLVEYGTGGIQLLKMIAISRLIFDGLIPHIQSSWLTNGVGMAQLALQYGADDFGGTLIGEEVVSCTGARSTELTDKIIMDAIHQIGYSVEERDNFYNPISVS